MTMGMWVIQVEKGEAVYGKMMHEAFHSLSGFLSKQRLTWGFGVMSGKDFINSILIWYSTNFI